MGNNHTTIQNFTNKADALYREAMSDQETAEARLLRALHKVNQYFRPEDEHMRCYERGCQYIEQEYSGELSRKALLKSDEFWQYWNAQWRKRNATLHAEAVHWKYTIENVQRLYDEDHSTIALACNADFRNGIVRITNKMKVY